MQRDNIQYASKWIQETATTPLDGIATVGGLWTAVNGIFFLFFGANIMYFSFGRQPLSALGIVHLFQRGSLIKRWHEDFPALHDEGDHPGDESAGIVAFIRERLVDLEPVEDHAGRDAVSGDLEAQDKREHSEISGTSAPPRSLETDVLLDPAHSDGVRPDGGPEAQNHRLGG